MTTRRIGLLAIVLTLQSVSVTQAQCLFGCTAVQGGAATPCDVVCTGAGTCNAPAGCDKCLPLDGLCTICGTDSTETINGTAGADFVCPAGGNDTIDTKGGNDTVYLGAITVSMQTGIPQPGADGPGGNTTIFLGAGNDGVGVFSCLEHGDDIIYGETGTDYIDAGNGRNFVDGGAGNDYLEDNSAGCMNPQMDDVVGSLLCGGAGNDVLYGSGPAHQCMDAGPDQVPGTENDCSYIFAAGGRAKTAFDLGTARRCTRSNVAVGGESCGCD